VRVDVAALLEEVRTHVPEAAGEPLEPVSPVEGHPHDLGSVLEGLLRRAAAGGAPARSACRDSTFGSVPCVEITIEGAGSEPERTTGAGDPALGPLFLTFCRIVATCHGGHLQVESEPDRGVRYRLRLPSLAPEGGRA
jgi:hypothetical protein